MKTKTLLLTAGLAIAGFAYWGYTEAQKLQGIFDKMTILPNAIHNLKIGLSTITFELDVKITNPTTDDFDIDGGFIADVKNLDIFYEGKYISTAQLNMNSISVPHQGSLIIHNIWVSVPTSNILDVLPNLLSFSMDKITTVAHVNILGGVYQIAN